MDHGESMPLFIARNRMEHGRSAGHGDWCGKASRRRQYTFHEDAMANKSDSRHGQRKEVETKVVVECGPPQPTYSLVTTLTFVSISCVKRRTLERLSKATMNHNVKRNVKTKINFTRVENKRETGTTPHVRSAKRRVHTSACDCPNTRPRAQQTYRSAIYPFTRPSRHRGPRWAARREVAAAARVAAARALLRPRPRRRPPRSPQRPRSPWRRRPPPPRRSQS